MKENIPKVTLKAVKAENIPNHAFCERSVGYAVCDPSERTGDVVPFNGKGKSQTNNKVVAKKTDENKVMLFRGRLPVLDDILFSEEAELHKQVIPEIIECMKEGLG